MASEGFIEEATELITGQFPVYRPWAEALALFMLSAANPEAKLPGGGKGLPLSLGFMGIGPSRLAFKSAPINEIVEPVLQKAGITLLPPRFTVEGYYSYIHQEKIQNAVLIRDEVSGLVAETRKQYLADELAFLCELLDGRLKARTTVTHGYIPSMSIRVSFLAAGTPHLFSILDEGFWVQGLGNRLIPVYWVRKVDDGSLPYEGYDEMLFDNKLQTLISHLEEFIKTRVMWVRPDKEVASRFSTQEFVRRERGYDDYFKDKWSILPAMYYECNVFIRKLSALKAINRQKGSKNPIITKEDFDWALRWIDERFEEFKEMYKDWQLYQTRKQMRTRYMIAEEVILAAVASCGGSATMSEIYQKTQYKMDAKTRIDTINNLVVSGKLKRTIKEGRTKPTVIYSLVEEGDNK